MIVFDGSEQPNINAIHQDAADLSQLLQITIFVSRDTTEDNLNNAFDHTSFRRNKIKKFRENRYKNDVNQIAAAYSNLTLVSKDHTHRKVILSGTVQQLNSAFNITLNNYLDEDSDPFISYEGPYYIDESLSSIIEAVFGLNTRKMGKPAVINHFNVSNTQPWTPAEVMQVYGISEAFDGTGETIAIVGASGYRTASNQDPGCYDVADVNFFRSFCGYNTPVDIADISIDGISNNSFGQPNSTNSTQDEFGIDVLCATTVAPGARIRVYWNDNTIQGWANCFQYIANDATNNPSIASFSIAINEQRLYTGVRVPTAEYKSLENGLKDLANAGVTFFAATGDWGQQNTVFNSDTSKVNVCYPAISAYTTAVGGTTLTVTGGVYGSEKVWNVNGSGVSEFIPKPSWQTVNVPTQYNTGFAGRGIPDFSILGDVQYKLYSRLAQDSVTPLGFYTVGGTSLSAPSSAGMLARINQQRGAPVGYLNPTLYAISTAAYRDITTGTNRTGTVGYPTTVGWDAASGFGSINGVNFGNEVIAYVNSHITPYQPYIADPQPAIIDANGNSWILDQGDGTNLLRIKVNGVLDTTATNVINLYKINGRIYYQNKNYNWFMKVNTTDPWASTFDPRIGAPLAPTTLPYTYQSWNEFSAMSWHCGQVIDNMLVTMIYRGASWNNGTNNPQKGVLTSAVSSFLASPAASLTEYYITKSPTLQSIEFFDSTAWPSSVNAAYIESYLSSLFDNRALTVPTTDKIMFMVNIPTIDAVQTRIDYVSNHSYFYYHGIPIVYGVNLGNSSTAMTNLEFQKWTTVNQILDAALDPYVGSGWFGFGNQGGTTSFGYQEPRQVPPTTISGVSTYGTYSNLAGKIISFNTTAPAILTNWYDNPGQDGSFIKKPFQTTAQWLRNGSLIDVLRNGNRGTPTGVMNIAGNWAVPWYIGRATDPLVTVNCQGKSIQVHIPFGVVTEGPFGISTDSTIGGCDVTKPYLVWSVSGATIDTGSIQNGSIITGTYGLQIDDGSGLILCDAVTGQPGTNNSVAASIRDDELAKAIADPNYIIPHMLQYALDPSQCSNQGPIWPLKVIDTSFPNTGGLSQGYTIGIPADVVRPTGKSRGWYLLFDNLQRFGWFFYNVNGAGCLTLGVYSTNQNNASLVNDIGSSLSDIMSFACILNNQNGLSSIKGFAPGGQDAFPAPPLLDYSPTNGFPVAPHTFGAWYPSGYDVTSVQSSTGTGLVAPAQARNVGYNNLILGDDFDFAGTIAPDTVTNLLKNTANYLAVTGAPGTLPTGWSTFGLGTLSIDVVAIGDNLNGMPYIDLRVHGTSSTSGTYIIFEGNDIAMVAGSNYTLSTFIALISGSLTNLSASGLYSDYSWSGGFLGTSGQAYTPTSTLNLASATFTAPPTITTGDVYFSMTWAANAATDLTLRFNGVQFEKASTRGPKQSIPLSGYNWYNWNPYGPGGGGNLPAGGYSVANSNLTITKDQSGFSVGLQTINKAYATGPGLFTHGYFEARMKYNQAGWQGAGTAWPAFWANGIESLQGANTYAELDFMEAYPVGQPTGTTLYITSIHEWTISPPSNVSNLDSYIPNVPGTDWTQYHTYGCLWTPNSITWYFDDQPVIHQDSGPGTRFPSLEHGNIYLLLGTGNDWPVQIDWVRVWGQ